jgi:hypothetical protein
MGLEITSPLHTSKGDTSAMYLHVDMMMLPKSGMNNVSVKRYLNQAARVANINDTCESYQVGNQFKLTLSVAELAAANVYTVIYGKLKAELIAAGLTVVDTI